MPGPDFDLLRVCRYSFDDFAEDAGPWVSLRGRNTSEFFGIVAALYLYM